LDFRHCACRPGQISKWSLRARLGSSCCAASAGPKLVGLNGFVDGHREVARQGVQRHRNALRRSIQQEHDLADELVLRWQVGELPDVRDGHHARSEEHTSELQSHLNLVCRLLLEKKKITWAVVNTDKMT